LSQIVEINAKSYPAMELGGAGLILLTVLVKRIEGTFKAYAGIVPDNSRADPHYEDCRGWVAQNGAKVPYEHAKFIFDLDKKRYAA
jgi:hypothetical protein